MGMGNSQPKASLPSREGSMSGVSPLDTPGMDTVFGPSLDASASGLPLGEEPPVVPVREPDQGKVPAVLRWENGGKKVSVAGTFSDWEKIPMSESKEDFTVIVNLTEGVHEYKYFVDDEWVHDPNEPTVPNAMGTLNNTVTISKADLESLDLDLEEPGFSSEEFGQEIPEKYPNVGPPQLPRVLLQGPLNKEMDPESDPTALPLPDHVLLNHLYALSIKDGVIVLASTQRYQRKYVTTLLYKPITL